MPTPNHQPEPSPSYFILHPDNTNEFKPFDPHLLGALKEAHIFITQPLRSEFIEVEGRSRTVSSYDMRRARDLIDMLERAIRKATVNSSATIGTEEKR